MSHTPIFPPFPQKLNKRSREWLKRLLLPRLLKDVPKADVQKATLIQMTSIEGATHSANDEILVLETEGKKKHVRFECSGPNRSQLSFLYRSLRKWEMVDKLRTVIKDTQPDLASRIPGPFDVFIVTKAGTHIDCRPKHLHLPNPGEVESVFALSTYEPDAESYYDKLIRKKNRTELSEKDRFEIDRIAWALSTLHAVSPTDMQSTLQKTAADGQLFIKEKLYRRITLKEHPLSFEHRHQFAMLMEMNMAVWEPHPERLHPSWGDLHPGNILITQQGLPLFIDPRTNEEFPDFFCTGLDVGFLFTDLWWYYRIWNNPAFKERAFLLLERYEHYSNDREIRKFIVRSGLHYRASFRLDSDNLCGAPADAVLQFFKDIEWWTSLGSIVEETTM